MVDPRSELVGIELCRNLPTLNPDLGDIALTPFALVASLAVLIWLLLEAEWWPMRAVMFVLGIHILIVTAVPGGGHARSGRHEQAVQPGAN
jgi:hypothetical protein